MSSYHLQQVTSLFEQHQNYVDNLWMHLHYFRIKDHTNKLVKPLVQTIKPTADLRNLMKQVLMQRAYALWERSKSHHVLVLEAQLQASALPGMGAGHVTENSLSLHPLYGVPYFPASSIKGLVRHWVMEAFGEEQQDSSSGSDKKETKWLVPEQVLQRMHEIFGGEPGDEKSFLRGSVQFDDAFLVDDFTIEPDVLTVHSNGYYNGDKAPSDKQEPSDKQDSKEKTDVVPVSFYSVKGKTVRFTLSVSKKEDASLLRLAEVWLGKAIQEFGLGAKTTSGYGWFGPPRDCTDEVFSLIELDRQKHEMERARRAEERRDAEERARLEAMSPSQKLLYQIQQLTESTADQAASKAELYRELWNLPVEEQREVAMALKSYWQRTGEWSAKKASKKQLEKVNRLREIVGE